jgi:hypothetical protein
MTEDVHAGMTEEVCVGMTEDVRAGIREAVCAGMTEEVYARKTREKTPE